MDGRMQSRVFSRMESLASLMAILGLMLGVPLALVLFVGWPLPHSIPAFDEVREAFEQRGVDVEVVINGLAIVVWVAWAQLAWALGTEMVAAIRGRTARPSPFPMWPGSQLLARRLVASAALVLSSFGSIRVANAAPLTPLQEVEMALDPELRAAEAQPAPARAPAPGVTSAPPSTTPPASSGTGAGSSAEASSTSGGGAAEPQFEQIYEVQRGDTFWGLADQFMGSGMRWRELRDRNVGRAVAPGRVLSMSDAHLDVGWRLIIPGMPSTAPPHLAPPGTLLSTLPEEDPMSAPLPAPPAPPDPAAPPDMAPVGVELDVAPIVVVGETVEVDMPPAPDAAPVPAAASAAAAAVPAPDITATEAAAPAPAPESTTVVAAVAESVGAQAMQAVVVAPGDHFWSMAERQLETAWGRPVAAEEIAPYWRDLVEMNASRLTSGNPDVIFPGEQFSAPTAPPDPVTASVSAAPPQAPPVQEAPADEPEQAPTPAPTPEPTPSATPTPAPTPSATPAPSQTPGTRDEETRPTTPPPTEAEAPPPPPPQPEATAPPATAPPGTAPPATAGPGAPPETVAPSTTAPPLSVPDSPDADADADEDETAGGVEDEDDGAGFPWLAVAGTAAFAGLVIAALRRRRQSRRRLARPGDGVDARPLEDIRTERALAVHAADVPEVVALASRALGAVIAATPELPPVTAVVVSPARTVAVYFAEPCLPVAPFVTGPPSDRWDLYLDDLGQDPGFEHAGPVLDTLTVLGKTDSDEWVFVDIESLGAVELAGDPVVGAELAQSMVAELSLQPAGEPLVDLTVIGMDRLAPVVADQAVVSIEHLDQDLVTRFERTAEDTGNFLDRQGLRSTAAARAQGIERDGLFVTVVAYGGAEPADPVLLERLAIAATPGGRGVAVVAVGPLGPGATRLVVTEDGRAHIPRLGITVTAARLAREDLDRVAQLLANEPERPRPEPRRANSTPDRVGPYEEPPWRFCIRVFADHVVETRDGHVISFRYGENPEVPNKNTNRGPELLAYLALSGRAASATEVRDHLWWDRPVALATVNKLLYGTRKVLGGAEQLSLAQDDPVGRYRLSPDVVTDAELLVHALGHAHAAADADPSLAADLLRVHLGQIEAVAFRSNALGQGLAEWAAAYRVIDRVEQPVIDAALLMAKLSTSHGPDAYGEALWAIDQGLKACPVNEALVRAAMELEALLGSPEASNARYQDLASRLAEDELEPEPETSDLRARIRRSGGRLSDILPET